MKNILTARLSLWFLVIFAGLPLPKVSAVTFSVTPSVIGNQYTGFITFQIAGLTNGETVAIEKYLDANTNGIIDAGEFAVQRFRVTDGQAALIGGVTNINVPSDADGSNGTINASINYQMGSQLSLIAGKFLIRLSSPTGNWTPLTNAFTVINTYSAQSISGNVLSSGTNVPNAIVILLALGAQGDSQLVGGAVADNSGHYNVGMAPGDYLVLATRSNYVADVSGPVVTLGAGVALTTNIGLLPATVSISGQIVDANSPSKGIPGIFIALDATNDLLAVTFTDVNGNFSAPVTASSWKVNPQEAELRLHGYLHSGSGNRISTVSGSVSGVSIPVSKAVSLIYGAVKDGQNVPIPGVNLNVADESGMFDNSHATTDANGNYALGLSTGTWDLNFDDVNSVLSNHVTTLWVGQTNLAPGTAFLQNFTLKLATNRVTGHLKTSQNVPIAGVAMLAYDGGSFLALPVDTDANGYYSLPVLNGLWTVAPSCSGGNDSLRAFGYSCISPQNTNINGADAILNFVVPIPTAYIRGHAMDDLGHPITFMNIFAFSTNGNGIPFEATTDANGGFVIGAVGGNYSIQLNTDPTTGVPSLGLVSPSISVSLTDGVDLNNVSVIARHVTGLIRVAVLNAGNNAGVPGIGVFGAASVGGISYFSSGITTDAGGHAALPVCDGMWQVSLNTVDLGHAGFGAQPFQSVSIAGNTNTLTFMVHAANVNAPGLSVSSPPVGGQFALTINGTAGQNYVVQYSTNLVGWSTLFTTNSAFNSFTVTDVAATNRARYYRVFTGP